MKHKLLGRDVPPSERQDYLNKYHSNTTLKFLFQNPLLKIWVMEKHDNSQTVSIGPLKNVNPHCSQVKKS